LKDVFNETFCDFFPQGYGGGFSSKILKCIRNQVIAYLKDFGKIFPMIAYEIHPQGYEGEGDSNILKDIKTQIKNLGKNSQMRYFEHLL